MEKQETHTSKLSSDGSTVRNVHQSTPEIPEDLCCSLRFLHRRKQKNRSDNRRSHPTGGVSAPVSRAPSVLSASARRVRKIPLSLDGAVSAARRAVRGSEPGHLRRSRRLTGTRRRCPSPGAVVDQDPAIQTGRANSRAIPDRRESSSTDTLLDGSVLALRARIQARSSHWKLDGGDAHGLDRIRR